jgi:WD40 repeat protein
MQDVAFHPTEPYLACGSMGGEDAPLLLYKYHNDDDADQDDQSPIMKVSCREETSSTSTNHIRAVEFAYGGAVVCGASATKNIHVIDLESEKIVQTIDTDDEFGAIHRMRCVDDVFPSHQYMVCTGDDAGSVALWDVRTGNASANDSNASPACRVHSHTDYVSDILSYPQKNAILSVSGDGTLCMMDVRMNALTKPVLKVRHRSEDDADDELLSVCVLRQGSKVVCGTTSGVLNIYSWGYWNDCSDRFPGHPDSVTSIVAIDDETILTGSSDGIIRVLSIQPNKLLGVLGEHSDFDIERIVLNADKSRLASISHDHTLKLWNSGMLLAEDEEDDDSDNDDGDDKNNPDEDDSDEDDSDDSGKKSKRKKKHGENKGAHKIPSKKNKQGNNDTNGGNFFADLL